MSWQEPYHARSVELSSQCKLSFPSGAGLVTALPQETGGRGGILSAIVSQCPTMNASLS